MFDKETYYCRATVHSALCMSTQNHLADIFTDFREDKEASGRGREDEDEKENFYD